MDTCLSRRIKRKMTQRTLLQLSFTSKSKAQNYQSESIHLGSDASCRDAADSPIQKTIHAGPVEESSVAKCEGARCESPFNLELIQQSSRTEELTMDEKIICNINSPSCLANNDLSKHDITLTTSESFGLVIETFIVGRRFSDEKELNIGASLCFIRDPHNVKDSNAIKVLPKDSGCCKVLGFLPREISQHLSPLIDKYSLNFEGRVTSVPEHSADVVPVEMVCQRMKSDGEMEHDDIDFRRLWKDALHEVERAKSCPPNTAKYQKNFCLLLQEVLQNNHHLFADVDRDFLEVFTSLSGDSQKLFVRLYTRKGPWFRMSNISYPDVYDSKEAVKRLGAMGYACLFEHANELLQDDDMKEILNMLTVPELREILHMFTKLPNGSRGAKKQDLVASLLSLYGDGLCPLLLNAILERTGACIRISQRAETLLWRAERLFFLNGEQNLSAFLLVDLGIVKYPTYNCIVSDPVFSRKSDLLAYEEAIEVAQIMDQSLDENNVDRVLRCIKVADSYISSSPEKGIPYNHVATFLSCFSAAWVYSKVILLGISYLERERSDGRRGYWTLRLSVDLEHIGHLNESLSVAEEGLLDPWVRAGSRMALQRRVLRLGKPPRRWKIPTFSESTKRKIKEVYIQGTPLNCETGTKSRFYAEDGEQCGVEQLALQYYAEEGGWKGVHSESGIWLTIFGILMWDIIFADVPNVFRTKFQTAPLDLETDSFYIIRENLVESHLQKIHDGMAEEILIISWQTHVGTSCRGVNWDRHSLSELRAAVTSIGGPCLASLCRHLAQDYHSWSSGMPDLLLWRFHNDYSGEAKLVEVKGPRDKLSEQQRAWLLLLLDCGFNAEVCKVTSSIGRCD